MASEMIEIYEGLTIPRREVQFEFIRSSGPGGQNVNKVASAVQLRFDVRASSIPQEIKPRLIKLAGRRMTREGVLVIDAHRFRTQEKNRADALERLAALVKRASRRPPARKAAKPSRAAREKRLKQKKQRGEIKSLRSNRSYD